MNLLLHRDAYETGQGSMEHHLFITLICNDPEYKVIEDYFLEFDHLVELLPANDLDSSIIRSTGTTAVNSYDFNGRLLKTTHVLTVVDAIDGAVIVFGGSDELRAYERRVMRAYSNLDRFVDTILALPPKRAGSTVLRIPWSADDIVPPKRKGLS